MSQLEFIAPDPNLCTEEEISKLVHTFYARARQDPSLGPIFEAHVTDWDTHFVQMINFWSMKLRGTNRFRGAPMPKHVALPGSAHSCSKDGCNCSGRQPVKWAIRFSNSMQICWLTTSERDCGSDIKWSAIPVGKWSSFMRRKASLPDRLRLAKKEFDYRTIR